MCGILGFCGKGDVVRAMTVPLALYMECRGKDSWGVTDGDIVLKEAKTISEGFVELGLDSPVYHTRQASCGAVSDRNAHPFDFTHEGKRVVGVHNGHISNWFRLKDHYKRAIEVDSENIFLHLAEGKDVGEIDGWGAVVWYEMPVGAPEKRIRYFSKLRDMDDNLHIARLSDGTIVFASTKTAIQKAARLVGLEEPKFWEVKAGLRYTLMPNPEKDGILDLYNVGEMNWGKNPLKYEYLAGASGESSNLRAINEWNSRTFTGGLSARSISGYLCNKPHCNEKLKNPKDLICDKCADKLLTEHWGAFGWTEAGLHMGMVN